MKTKFIHIFNFIISNIIYMIFYFYMKGILNFFIELKNNINLHILEGYDFLKAIILYIFDDIPTFLYWGLLILSLMIIYSLIYKILYKNILKILGTYILILLILSTIFLLLQKWIYLY